MNLEKSYLIFKWFAFILSFGFAGYLAAINLMVLACIQMFVTLVMVILVVDDTRDQMNKNG